EPLPPYTPDMISLCTAATYARFLQHYLSWLWSSGPDGAGDGGIAPAPAGDSVAGAVGGAGFAAAVLAAHAIRAYRGVPGRRPAHAQRHWRGCRGHLPAIQRPAH